jgi:hypothetical protein
MYIKKYYLHKNLKKSLIHIKLKLGLQLKRIKYYFFQNKRLKDIAQNSGRYLGRSISLNKK